MLFLCRASFGQRILTGSDLHRAGLAVQWILVQLHHAGERHFQPKAIQLYSLGSFSFRHYPKTLYIAQWFINIITGIQYGLVLADANHYRARTTESRF